MTSAAEELRMILNGPVVAGVGATVDAGLPSDKFHVLPWDPTKTMNVRIVENDGGLGVRVGENDKWYKGSVDDLLKYAIWNATTIGGIDNIIAGASSAEESMRANLRNDTIAIVFLMLTYGYYSGECRQARPDEKGQIEKLTVSKQMREDIINVSRLNRAATFILARMHTKYQTNHAIGGTPMQASIASSVRAFYSVSPTAAKTPGAQAVVSAIASALYWAVHPANETLLIPCVIQNSMITHSRVHTEGTYPVLMAVEEYFNIRARTPPASTHHFYVAAAAIKQLEPMGILPYLPEPTRTRDIVAGLRMISTHGAKLHPAARYWGLERLTSNQKLVETICSDLGYAVRKLMPASSLAASPILMKEDGLDSAWKQLIDSIRNAMDERGKELLDAGVFEQIRKAIAPTASELEGLSEIKGYLTSGKPEKREDESEGDGDDDDDDAPGFGPPGGSGGDDDDDQGPDNDGDGSSTRDPAPEPESPQSGKPGASGSTLKPSRGRGNYKGKGKAHAA